MDLLHEAANEYARLLNKIYIFRLENKTTVQVYFTPGHFHHLMGLHKLADINVLVKDKQKNDANSIYKNILAGRISYDDLAKSRYLAEIEQRLIHFKQINRIIEYDKIIIDFDPSLIASKLKADYILLKRSNDNMYSNLFLTKDSIDSRIHVPSTFMAEKTDYYTYGQKIINIVSMTQIVKGKHIKTEP